MTPERWQKVEAILQDALDRPPQERDSVLDEAFSDDEELRNETATLIAAHNDAGDFIEQPAIVQDAQVVLGHQLGNNIGREIGVYRIVDCLGAGGMGEVYLAEDSRLDRLVALKLLPAYFASDDERLARFQREARTASALNHPNILTIHEVGEADGVRFIATEFIDGQTIQELIVQQELTLAEILDIATQIVSGLATAHAAGIVHRDIKPDNIMRRGDGLVKILDFGIAKLLELPTADTPSPGPAMFTETGVVVGTVGYMSPEQARGLAIDERTDIWSFGVVLYQMLTHRLPFKGATRMDTLVDILEREPLPLLPVGSNVSPELQSLAQLVEKTMQKNREDRFQTALELQNELNRVRQGLDNAGVGKAETFTELISTSEVQRLGADAVKTKRAPGLFVFLALGFAVLLAVVIAGAFAYRNLVTPRQAQRNATAPVATTDKSYGEMTDAEQLAFIDAQEQRISTMMGDRPGKLDEDAIRAIKKQIDYYVSISTSGSGAESLDAMYARARPYLPTIARSFAARKVPVIIGIYLPMIESAYRPCYESPIGAKGLFQFLPQTARHYQVASGELCDVEKVAPAAAHYIADHMAELGDDAESMTLVLLSYNTGSSFVRGSLRQLRDSDDYERTFWMLFRNREHLGESFRIEGAGYVPMFFAAAIIGENPQNFGLKMEPLSTLTGVSNLATPPLQTN